MRSICQRIELLLLLVKFSISDDTKKLETVAASEDSSPNDKGYLWSVLLYRDAQRRLRNYRIADEQGVLLLSKGFFC
jgi:hypothetical protein